MKTVIEMAREAGWTGPEDNLAYVAMLERFAELVRADERARMAEQQTDWEAVAADQAMTIALLRAEQPAQQEPVAVVSGYYGGQCVILPIDPARIFNSNTALYTSPPASKPWVGLTDDEIEARAINFYNPEMYKRAVLWAQEKLKERNQ